MTRTDGDSGGSKNEIRKLLYYAAIAYGILGLAAFNKFGTEGLNEVVGNWVFGVMLMSLLGIIVCFLLIFMTFDIPELMKSFGLPVTKISVPIFALVGGPGFFALILFPAAWVMPDLYSEELDRRAEFRAFEISVLEVDREFANKETQRIRDNAMQAIEGFKERIARHKRELESDTSQELIKAKKEFIRETEQSISKLQEIVKDMDREEAVRKEKNQRVQKLIDDFLSKNKK